MKYNLQDVTLREVLMDILPLSQDNLIKYIHKVLKETNKENKKLNYRKTEKFILVTSVHNGECILKPLICVHLDTINDAWGYSKNFYCKSNYTIYGGECDFNFVSLQENSKLSCLGGDDRCGVAIALKLISDKDVLDKYHFAFFVGEESGGIGSSAFAKDALCIEFVDNYVNCFIGLDRSNQTVGQAEMAVYNYDNEKLFKLFLTKDGYKKSIGSFTDASNLSRYFHRPCLNLSVGYNLEHSRDEYIFIQDMEFTYDYLRHLPIIDGEYEVEKKGDIFKGFMYDRCIKY